MKPKYHILNHFTIKPPVKSKNEDIPPYMVEALITLGFRNTQDNIYIYSKCSTFAIVVNLMENPLTCEQHMSVQILFYKYELDNDEWVPSVRAWEDEVNKRFLRHLEILIENDIVWRKVKCCQVLQ